MPHPSVAAQFRRYLSRENLNRMRLKAKIREIVITIKNCSNRDNIIDVGTERIMEVIIAEENENLYSLQRPDRDHEKQNTKKQ